MLTQSTWKDEVNSNNAISVEERKKNGERTKSYFETTIQNNRIEQSEFNIYLFYVFNFLAKWQT